MQKPDNGILPAAKAGGIVLFAKRPGYTSFFSLYTIKHALNTSKVGHTGTLDSFACGLLVVCAGPLTRVASRITEFDKTYDAVIKFGAETDTLEYTGSTVRTAPLPAVRALEDSVRKFTGNIMQKPPAFSAIHVNGQRAGDLVRSGKTADIPARPVTVYEAEIRETETDGDGKVEIARITFRVSKGTYIRSLARDIGAECGSAAHLVGLMRTSVGPFRLEDAAGFSLLEEFSIDSALRAAGKNTAGVINNKPERNSPEELEIQREIREKITGMTEDFAVHCGFFPVHLRAENTSGFLNGQPIRSNMFTEDIKNTGKKYAAVFDSCGRFAGLLEKAEDGRLHYSFVIPA